MENNQKVFIAPWNHVEYVISVKERETGYQVLVSLKNIFITSFWFYYRGESCEKLSKLCSLSTNSFFTPWRVSMVSSEAILSSVFNKLATSLSKCIFYIQNNL